MQQAEHAGQRATGCRGPFSASLHADDDLQAVNLVDGARQGARERLQERPGLAPRHIPDPPRHTTTRRRCHAAVVANDRKGPAKPAELGGARVSPRTIRVNGARDARAAIRGPDHPLEGLLIKGGEGWRATRRERVPERRQDGRLVSPPPPRRGRRPGRDECGPRRGLRMPKCDVPSCR